MTFSAQCNVAEGLMEFNGAIKQNFTLNHFIFHKESYKPTYMCSKKFTITIYTGCQLINDCYVINIMGGKGSKLSY